jgi:hypothetical protein
MFLGMLPLETEEPRLAINLWRDNGPDDRTSKTIAR